MRAAIAGMALAMWLASGAALAASCAGFTDVDTSSSFCVNVAWLKTHNITLGCTATTYCPGQPVTRLQMAAFLNRLENVAFMQGGNAFAATARLGTTDTNTVEIIAGNKRGFRIEPNNASANVIGGYENNGVYAGVVGATIAGGGAPGTEVLQSNCAYAFNCQNSITDHYGTIGGGAANLVGDTDGDLVNGSFATVGGGLSNAATDGAFVGGGLFNSATGSTSVVAGGAINKATAQASTVGGGQQNVASSYDSTVSGGYLNQATNAYSAIGGGEVNVASGEASFVAGGYHNTAEGRYSFASGVRAYANYDGCVVFDNGTTDSDNLYCGGENRFVVRAYGGYYLYSARNAGSYLAAGSNAWAVLSDRNAKSEITPVDTHDVLARLAAIPMNTWRWNSEPGTVIHMGPMAQDFYAAFGLGDSDKRIVTVDADGVALAAIQALHSRARESEAAVQARLAEKDARIDALELRLEKMETLLLLGH